MLLRAGDIAWVELGPVRGGEQDGRRPALFLSDSDYHEISRRAVVCPISSTERPWPFHVPLPAGLATTGFVLVDQIRTIGRTERMFDFIEHAQNCLGTAGLVAMHRSQHDETRTGGEARKGGGLEMHIGA